MIYEEKEVNLINDFRMLKSEEIVLVSDELELEEILKIIFNDVEWGKWVDSSEKDAPPPDFYNVDKKIMMEVMRVDDRGFRKHGKTKNALREKEHKIEKELKSMGIIDMFPKANLIINAVTDLPKEEDHNYKRYYANFKRTVQQHAENIKNYRDNHKGYKLIFFIFDESTPYAQVKNTNKLNENTSYIWGQRHFYFLDKRFLECFNNVDVDYLIWMAPYKTYINLSEELQMPKAAIYKIGKKVLNAIEYEEESMTSTEK